MGTSRASVTWFAVIRGPRGTQPPYHAPRGRGGSRLDAAAQLAALSSLGLGDAVREHVDVGALSLELVLALDLEDELVARELGRSGRAVHRVGREVPARLVGGRGVLGRALGHDELLRRRIIGVLDVRDRAFILRPGRLGIDVGELALDTGIADD